MLNYYVAIYINLALFSFFSVIVFLTIWEWITHPYDRKAKINYQLTGLRGDAIFMFLAGFFNLSPYFFSIPPKSEYCRPLMITMLFCFIHTLIFSIVYLIEKTKLAFQLDKKQLYYCNVLHVINVVSSYTFFTVTMIIFELVEKGEYCAYKTSIPLLIASCISELLFHITMTIAFVRQLRRGKLGKVIKRVLMWCLVGLFAFFLNTLQMIIYLYMEEYLMAHFVLPFGLTILSITFRIPMTMWLPIPLRSRVLKWREKKPPSVSVTNSKQ